MHWLFMAVGALSVNIELISCLCHKDQYIITIIANTLLKNMEAFCTPYAQSISSQQQNPNKFLLWLKSIEDIKGLGNKPTPNMKVILESAMVTYFLNVSLFQVYWHIINIIFYEAQGIQHNDSIFVYIAKCLPHLAYHHLTEFWILFLIMRMIKISFLSNLQI